MPIVKIEPRWPERFADIESEVDTIHLPSSDGMSQDAEWCEVVIKGRRRRIRFHDYHKLYEVPGLFEEVFYNTLRCCSPSRTVHLLENVLDEADESTKDMRVLDVGAGNGMVGDELELRGVDKLVGIDIIPEAKEAALRDRPGVYDDYFVTDLTELPENLEKRLRSMRLNCLTTVAALGFGDIPSAAFLKALDLIETPGWLAFNIKEDFLRHQDQSGFAGLIHQLNQLEIIQIQAYRRYCHRLSVSGKPLYYVAMVASKLQDVPDRLFPNE